MTPLNEKPPIKTTLIGLGRDLAARMDVRRRPKAINKLLGRLRLGLRGRANDT